MFALEYFIMYLFVFILGLVLGSYLNSWIWRIHEHKYVFGGRSICIHCSRPLAWYENIPLFSFLVLRGKCRTCHAKIPVDYFLVELFTGLTLVGLVIFHSNGPLNLWAFLRDVFFVALLIVTFVYDFKYSIILPGVVWLGSTVGFLINFFELKISLSSMLIGVAIGGGFFLLQYVVSKGRWIGGGDIRFGVLMGVWLGWPNVLFALFLSYILGACYAVPLLVAKKKTMNSEVPFGTFLTIGTLAALLYGSAIIRWYFGFLK